MEVTFYVTSCFFRASFKILSLSLTFDNLIIMCLGVAVFGFHLPEILGSSDLDV